MGKTYTAEQMKKAFYEVFSGSGELWFSYFHDPDDSKEDTKAYHDSYVDPYWEDFMEKLDK